MRAAETAGGYAREMGEDFARRQREMITQTLRRTDIVICTALIPGRRAPVLLTADMVAGMMPGSVIVDLAVEAGGNVEGSRLGEIATTANGVKIIGHPNMPSRIAVDASQLYARNLLAFLGVLTSIWAEKFDHAAAVTNFVVQPMALLSGTFYSVDKLMPAFRIASHANPFFHVIAGFRYGFIGVSDAHVLFGAVMLLAVNLALGTLCYTLLARGWRLKA